MSTNIWNLDRIIEHILRTVYQETQRVFIKKQKLIDKKSIMFIKKMQSMDNAYMTRLDRRTPFKGLYLASAWTRPGGGYQPCLESGADAFKALVKDLADI